MEHNNMSLTGSNLPYPAISTLQSLHLTVEFIHMIWVSWSPISVWYILWLLLLSLPQFTV